MRGTIIKRKGVSTYTIVLNLGKDPITGHPKRQWVSVKGNKREAERRLAELTHQLNTGSYVKPRKLTVGDYMEQWLADYCLPNLQPRTTEGYGFIVRKYIIPSLGNIELTALRPEHLQRFYTEKLASGGKDGTGLSPRSVRYCHTTLHKALKSAMRLGILARNPADAVDPPRLKPHEMQIMSEDDIQKLLELAKDTQYYQVFYLALYTGLRRSELLGLKWADVDLILCQLSVARSLQQLRNGKVVEAPCKTDKSKRMVSLSPRTAIMLRQYKDQQTKLRKDIDIPITEKDYVFSHYDGSPILPDSLSQAWRHLATKAGLKNIRLHDCRHTHASLMLKAGIHPKIVSERLGHAGIQITLDTYSHVSPGLQEAAANAFDNIVMPQCERVEYNKLLAVRS
jgi:integrase